MAVVKREAGFAGAAALLYGAWDAGGPDVYLFWAGGFAFAACMTVFDHLIGDAA